MANVALRNCFNNFVMFEVGMGKSSKKRWNASGIWIYFSYAIQNTKFEEMKLFNVTLEKTVSILISVQFID